MVENFSFQASSSLWNTMPSSFLKPEMRCTDLAKPGSAASMLSMERTGARPVPPVMTTRCLPRNCSTGQPLP